MRAAALLALITVATAAELTAPDNLRYDFYKLEDDLWKNVTDPSWSNAGLGGDVELTKAFARFSDELDSVAFSRPALDFWLWRKALEKMRPVESMYEHFVGWVRRQAVPGAVPAPVREWLDMAEAVLMDPQTSTVRSINALADVLQHGDLFRSALQEEHPDLCELQMSPHQMVYDMYNTVALTEIKGYAMMQFSWMLLRIYGKGNFTQEASLTRQRYAERTARTATAARTALAMAPRTLHRCDPPRHEEGVTYAQVTRLLQGYVENEVDMNADGSCKENCAYYTLAQNHGCYDDKYCTKREPCRGRLLECQYIDSDMWVCPASGQSSRRYEWIRYENERTLGRVGSCARGTTKVDSWWRWVFWHCSYCMCLCDEEGPRSDRYFSLRDAAADVANNKVVTGVRLVKLGRVFHLQVSEGELGERGRVTPGSWVPLQKFDPLDMAVQEGRDYHTLTYEKRAVDLDQLDSPEGHVLTGIRFRMHGPHLHFEIRSTPFNYTSGRLYHEKSQWVSNDNTDGAEKPRTRLSLISPDIPTRRASPLPIDSQHDQYVEFTHSDLEADAAQSTVPFLDIQPLRPLGGAALASGAGLAHRGARGSGGYLTLQLLTYDYSRHVRAEAPPTDFGDEDTTDFVPIVN